MEKRSWPWKKKSSDKSSISADGDEKVRRLTERLVAANDLAKEHATVAEEAVSGWENAKAEFTSLKSQLDAALEQKQAAEVRVFHLDGALKECMQQLRQAREEQEQSIHEAIVKRSREWDRSRLDLEERLEDAEGRLASLGTEKTLLFKKVQEQAEAIAELGGIRSEAEAEILKLHMQVQALEKENTQLKYEIIVVNKELGIRNQEREMNKRALDMANQQHTESTKKAAKLEAECQKLRTLVRKKLPGPGALFQMKLEAGIDAERCDCGSKRRSSARAAALPKASYMDNTSLVSERVLTCGEEAEMPKQAFSKKTKEQVMSPRSPQVACIGPSLHVVKSPHSHEHTHISLSEIGHDHDDDDQSVADSWSSGMTMQLACFQKEKSSLQQPSNHHGGRAFKKLNSTDDFLELERLVSLPSENQGGKPIMKVEQLPSSIRDPNPVQDMAHSKDMASELFSLQQKLLAILNSPNRQDAEIVLENIKKAVLDSRCSFVDGLQIQVTSISSSSTRDQGSNGICSLEAGHVVESSQVETWICKVIRIVEDLAMKSVSDFRESRQANDNVSCQDIQTKRKLQLQASVKSFVAVANAYLYGKTELAQFMAALYHVLDPLNTLFKAYKPYSGRMKWRLEAVQAAEQEVVSDVGSPFSLSSNSDRSDSLARKDSTADERFANGKVHVERAAPESSSGEQFGGVSLLQHVIAELKQGKMELENKLEEERCKLEAMKCRLVESEQLVVTLRARLASVELSGAAAEKSMSSVSPVTAQLESRLENSQLELARLREKLKNVESLYDQEKRRHEELETRSEELRAVQRDIPGSLQEDAETIKKDQDIADATEKLAECQRTILVLGQQLKDIVLAQDGHPAAAMYPNQAYGNAGAAELLHHGNSMQTLHESKQRSPLHQVACGISEFATDTFANSPKSPGHWLEEQAAGLLGEKSPLYRNERVGDASKQLVPYVPKQESSKQLTLRTFPSPVMSKSLNLDPSASPRKHGNSFRQLFLRHKTPS